MAFRMRARTSVHTSPHYCASMADGRSAELITLLSSESPAVEDGLLLLSQALQTPDPDDDPPHKSAEIVLGGQRILDELAAATESSGSSTPDIDMIVNGIFVDAGFTGDVENYHAEDNSFLDRVLERRIGMPITLSAVAVAVGRRLGLDLELIGLPGHVVVGVPGDSNVFIDAYGGAVVDRVALQHRLASIFGRDIEIRDSSLTPMSTTAVVTRVSNNLMRTWADKPDKFDRLLDLRVQLPVAQGEQQMLIEIAEARARFDLAARLKEQADPNDPDINALWGRLN